MLDLDELVREKRVRLAGRWLVVKDVDAVAFQMLQRMRDESPERSIATMYRVAARCLDIEEQDVLRFTSVQVTTIVEIATRSVAVVQATIETPAKEGDTPALQPRDPFAHVIVTVACATGRAVLQVILDPWARTLFTYLAIEDSRRLDRVIDEGDRLSLGGLVAIAFNEPQKLADLQRRFVAGLQPRMPREEVFKRAAEILRREAEGLAKQKTLTEEGASQ